MELTWSKFKNCPLCGQDANQFRDWFEDGSVKVAECGACHFKFLNPYVSPESMVEIYSSAESMTRANEKLSRYYENFETSETKKYFEYCVDVLGALTPPGELLDIGCGRGKFLQVAREAGWKVTGLEPAKEHADYASRVQGFNVLNTSIEQAFLHQESFDVVTLWDVIEHVENPKEVLRKVESWLKPGGFLLVATPNHESLLNSLAKGIFFLSGRSVRKPLEFFFVPEHVLYFTPSTLRKLIRESGFELIRFLSNGTDIDRYQVGWAVKTVAKILLPIARILRWENRMVGICLKPENLEVK